MSNELIKLNKYKEYIKSHITELEIDLCKSIDEIEDVLISNNIFNIKLDYDKFYRHYLSHNDIKISDDELNNSYILYLGSIKLFIPISQYGFNLTHKISYKIYFEYNENISLIQCSDDFNCFKFKGLEETPKFIKDNIVSFLTKNKNNLVKYFYSNTISNIELNTNTDDSLNYSKIENYHNF